MLSLSGAIAVLKMDEGKDPVDQNPGFLASLSISPYMSTG